MASIADRVRRVEDRLERLLAAGWRNDSGDLAALRDDLPRLESVGLKDLATRIRLVVETEPASLLAAVSPALAACRLLRARLSDLEVPRGAWEPLTGGKRGAGHGMAKLVPIGRVALGRKEAWACVRLRGWSIDWLLLEPPDDRAPRSPWLRPSLSGRLAWRGRYPLGASGDVALAEPRNYVWVDPGADDGDDPLSTFRQALADDALKDGTAILRESDRLQVRKLGADDAEGCAWPDPAMAAAFRAAAPSPRWTIVFVEATEVVTPLAIVEPSGVGGSARVVHLVEGGAEEEVAL